MWTRLTTLGVGYCIYMYRRGVGDPGERVCDRFRRMVMYRVVIGVSD